MEDENFVLTPQEFARIANNFYYANNWVADPARIAIDSYFIQYFQQHSLDAKKKFKVALCCICLNSNYWQYVKNMIEGARQFFLPGHDVDVLFWSDIPKPDDLEAFQKAEKELLERNLNLGRAAPPEQIIAETKDAIVRGLESAKLIHANNLFPLEPIEWPMPTLMRYHTFLQQEERLKEYDYVFYCDVDMRFVGIVGDEILSEGLTAAQHPMYALDKRFWPPYEPNEKSTAYIKRPGQVINDNGQPRFMPLYFAGGLQGGKTEKWIEAMKVMRNRIDEDFNNDYVSIWNDESHWNKYLFENPPTVVLTPSYIFPDSLIKEYYEKIWGYSYQPKLITITKKDSQRMLTAQQQQELSRLQGI